MVWYEADEFCFEKGTYLPGQFYGDPREKWPPLLRTGDVHPIMKGCDKCNPVTGKCADKCIVSCPAGSISTNGIESGIPHTCKRKAKRDEETYSDRRCEQIGVNKGKCLKSREGANPCCWMPDASSDNPGQCVAWNSPDLKTLPNACAALHRDTWDEMPFCTKTCTNDFSHVMNIEYGVIARDACSKCLPTKDGDGSCEGCVLMCLKGYEHAGGGPEGPRSCSDRDLKMKQAPYCVKIVPQDLCPDIVGTTLEATGDCKGTNKCVGGATDCPCEVNCAKGFVADPKGGFPQGEKKCLLKPNPDLNRVVNCERQDGEYVCLNSYEEVDEASGNPRSVPCCYRSDAFSSGLIFGLGATYCAAKGSEKITADKPYDGCAKMDVAVWQDLPTCVPFCYNIFKDISTIKKDTISKCEECAVGGPCECEAYCADGKKRIPTGPEEGSKKCIATGDPLLPRFEDPPQCEAAQFLDAFP
jgi:hypothetical protein